MTLNGTNLSGTTSVVFGTANGLDVTVVSDSEIEVLVPSAKRGTVELTVQTPAGLSDQVDFAIR